MWPGNDQVFLLDRGEKKSIPITCEVGETICWAAWVNGRRRHLLGRRPGHRPALRRLLRDLY